MEEYTEKYDMLTTKEIELEEKDKEIAEVKDKFSKERVALNNTIDGLNIQLLQIKKENNAKDKEIEKLMKMYENVQFNFESTKKQLEYFKNKGSASTSTPDTQDNSLSVN